MQPSEHETSDTTTAMDTGAEGDIDSVTEGTRPHIRKAKRKYRYPGTTAI